jgi:PRTRC genetic system protein C
MQAKAMRREFFFQGLKLGDPDSKMSLEDVRGALSLQYPEIATAAISGPEAVGDTMKYTFERAIGSKG